MIGALLKRIGEKEPLIHCITNYVTADVCAELLLAVGARPVMADAPEEAAEIALQSDGLLLNIGTPSVGTLRAMRLAGEAANAKGIPVVFDPVGAGASAFRTEEARKLIGSIACRVIRGNRSELEAVLLGKSDTRGVDAVGSFDPERALPIAGALAEKTGSVVVLTGETDIGTDGKKAFFVRNGCKEMQKTVGTGCGLSALIAAFCAATPDDPFTASLAAVCLSGYAGECAKAGLRQSGGAGSFGVLLTDAVSRMTAEALEGGARYEIR